MRVWKQFIESFKTEPKLFGKLILIFLLFEVFAAQGLILVKNTLETAIAKIDLPAATSAQLDSTVAQLETLSWIIVALIILIIVFLVALWSIAFGLTFTQILKKKFTQKYFFKFCGLNLIYGILMAVIITADLAVLAVLSSIADATLMTAYTLMQFVIIIVLLYFGALSYAEFTKKNEIITAISKGLERGVKEFKKLWKPAGLVILVWTVFYVIGAQLFINQYLQTIYRSLIIAWTHKYYVPIVK